MELDFDKFCVIEGNSPKTVLKPPRNSSKTARKDFREISLNRYRSASCRDARSEKRGSVYRSSEEVNFLEKNYYESSERKKIEFSRGAACETSIDIIDALCASDENRCTTSSSCKNRFGILSESRERFASSRSDDVSMGPTRPVIRLSSSKKTGSDPSVESNSRRSLVKIPETSAEMEAKPFSDPETSPAHLQGTLRIHYKHDGFPSFEFSVRSPEDSYVAKTWRVENELTRVYTFHRSRHHQRRRKSSASGWGHRESCGESNVLGQMHASRRLSTEFFDNDDVATEFVLYDVSARSKPLPSSDLRPVQEVAAIVLERAGEGISDISNRGTVHVVVPCGNHGSPLATEATATATATAGDARGPNRLLERWRLGGGCDCGGWDMACPIDVLRNSIPRPTDDRSPDVILHLQGRKDGIPSFSMRRAEDGKYSVSFHARLSSLQAFAICVAAIFLRSAEESSALGRDRSVIVGGERTLQSDSLRVFPEEEIDNLVEALSSEEGEQDKLTPEKRRQQAQSFLVIPPFSPIARA